jgi:hypothetical protein
MNERVPKQTTICWPQLRWWKKWWKQDKIKPKIMDKTHQSWMKQHFTKKKTKNKKPCMGHVGWR